jgi:hypothetical protein
MKKLPTKEEVEGIQERNALLKRQREPYAAKPEDEDETAKIDNELDQITQQLDELNRPRRCQSTDVLNGAAIKAAFAEVDGEDWCWTEAEIEDEKRIQAERPEAKRKWEAAISKYPRLAFKGIFKACWSGYLNIPLPLLAVFPFATFKLFPYEEKEQREKRQAGKRRLCAFLRDYALMYVTRKLYQQTIRDVMTFPQPAKLPKGINPANQKHRLLGGAMYLLKRQGGSMKRFRHHWKQGRAFLKEHGIDDDDKANRDQPRVQVALALLGSEHPYLSERDLRVLLAVNCACGNEGWRQVNQGALGVWAVGATQKTLAELNVQPLTRRQVQLSLGKLCAKGLIHFGTWRHRICYVGNSSLLSLKTWTRIVAEQIEARLVQRSPATKRTLKITDADGEVAFVQNGKVVNSYPLSAGVAKDDWD